MIDASSVPARNGYQGGGRPRIAAERVSVTFLIPTDVYDRACREAHRRREPLAVVLRETLMRRYQAAQK